MQKPATTTERCRACNGKGVFVVKSEGKKREVQCKACYGTGRETPGYLTK